MIQKPKGTRDILPGEIDKWQYIENLYKTVVENYGFKEIRLPVFENTELFLRGVGDTTDIVQKEMYTFEDKGGRSISLRPEGTAGCVRAYLEDGMASLPSPVKMWYNISTYRYENVQKGRYREFRQLGAELFGTSSYIADAEVITMANEFFKRLKLNDTIQLELNSIGCPTCRSKYQDILRKYVQDNIDMYCDDCKSRLEKNPMRILDCKNESCKKANVNAPIITEYLCDECNTHFEGLKKILDETGIKYVINPKLVRGLDYYTKTVFEFVSKDLGFTLLGGGRYDLLVGELGGQDTPALGFAMGEDRLVEVYTEEVKNKRLQLFIATIGEKAESYATKLAKVLRENDVYVERDVLNRSVKSQFKYADKMNAKYVITIGDTEVDTNRVKIKDMDSGNEEEVELDKVLDYIKK